MTFENLYDQVTEHGDRDFIVYFQDEKKCAVTGTEYRKITDYFTSFLSEKLSGIEEKSWVALKSKNDPFWFAALFALLRLGYNVLMMDADADDVQTEAFRCQCGFKAIVADRECKCGDLPCITMNEIKESDKVKFCGKSRWSNKIGFCTSGTTGNAKIYVFSAEAICWQCENIAYFALNNKEITGSQLVPGMENNPILLTMPFRHCMGF